MAISQYLAGSQERHRRRRNRLQEIATAPLGPRNDKLGGVCGRRECLETCNCPWRSLSAATDAIGACHFNGSWYELQVPSRDCHVASLLAMTRQAGAAVHQRPHAVECSPTGRSLSAATDAIGTYRFIGSLYGLRVPSRDCHVASLLAMTRQGGARCTSALLPLNGSVQGGHYPQGARRIRKAAKPPTAAQ